MPDAIFDDPRLAQVYDLLDPDRRDLEVYASIVDEIGARSVLDIGCGTGTLACMLARRGLEVIGLDPAAASLDVARSKPGSRLVRWLEGEASTMPDVRVDAVLMTGNVAQVFLTEEDWEATLAGARSALRPGGWLVFETRDPARRAWTEWTPDRTRRTADVAGIGRVEAFEEVLDVSGDLVTFRTVVTFQRDAVVLESRSTLRFRGRDEVETTLTAAGLDLHDVRDAPDRPGRELVFLARRPVVR